MNHRIICDYVVREIFDVILRLEEEGIPILLVEQNAKAALRVSERCYVMETGRIVLHGFAHEMMEDERVKMAFLGKDYRER